MAWRVYDCCKNCYTNYGGIKKLFGIEKDGCMVPEDAEYCVEISDRCPWFSPRKKDKDKSSIYRK